MKWLTTLCQGCRDNMPLWRSKPCTTGLMTVCSESVRVATLDVTGAGRGAALAVRYASSGFSGAYEAAFSRLCFSR